MYIYIYIYISSYPISVDTSHSCSYYPSPTLHPLPNPFSVTFLPLAVMLPL